MAGTCLLLHRLRGVVLGSKGNDVVVRAREDMLTVRVKDIVQAVGFAAQGRRR